MTSETEPQAFSLKAQLRSEAERLGFQAFGVSSVHSKDIKFNYFSQWIEDGCHGDMEWMKNNTERRANPLAILPTTKSIICLGLNYYQPAPPRRGRIAKYALGKDYHTLILKKLKALCALLREHGGINKPYVDTGPILEKPWSALASLGWQAKNTMLINRTHGQWLFLSSILTSLELPPDPPAPDRCGTCTRCLDVCPTQAITAPYQLDARKCISYLTIEYKGPIPLSYRKLIGDHLYGCDDCLDICPWNKWAKVTREAKFQPLPYPDLRDMLSWDDEAFNTAFAGTPIKRLRRPRWLRNVCVVLGNTGTQEDLPALHRAALDPDPLIAEHARWAIEQLTNSG